MPSNPEWKPRYSGPDRSGVCICGHAWDRHHLGCVMNEDYFKATKESYIAQECEAYGFNEAGGLMCVDGDWVPHCHGYKDTLDKD